MSTITVLYFAALAELTRQREERLDLPARISTVEHLLGHLESTRPELKGRFGSVRVAINEDFVTLEHALQTGDVVALIPPVAGG